MLALQSSSSSSARRKPCTPHILPCRIHRNGPANAVEKYWNPSTNLDGSRTSYLRGRKLRGRKVKVPKGYRGVVVAKTDRVLPTPTTTATTKELNGNGDSDCEILDDDEPEVVKVLEEAGSFDELVVWGHDALPGAEDGDVFVRGVEEWVRFAEAMHSSSEGAKEREPGETR